MLPSNQADEEGGEEGHGEPLHVRHRRRSAELRGTFAAS